MRFYMKHYIIVKWNDQIKDKNSVLSEIRAIFNKTLEIEGVRGIELIQNVVDRPNRHDLIIRIDMEKESLPLYDVSEPHKEWKEKFSKYIETKTIFDSEE